MNAQVHGASRTVSGQTSGGTGLGLAIPSSTGGRCRPEGGDVVTALDGTRIPDGDALADATSGHAPGDVVSVKVTRDGAQRTVEVTLGHQPARARS